MHVTCIGCPKALRKAGQAAATFAQGKVVAAYRDEPRRVNSQRFKGGTNALQIHGGPTTHG